MLRSFNNFFKLDNIAILYIIFYFAVGIFTLNSFPPVFSDEIWLGEIAFNLAEHGKLFQSAFPFSQNDTIHTGNYLFILNALAIKIFGFNIFALRFFTFIAFTLTLFFLYLLLKKFFDTQLAFLVILLYSINPFAINSSRLARSETFIIFSIILALYLFFEWYDCHDLKRNSLIGIIVASPILVHPYGIMSFLIGFSLFILYFLSKFKKNSIKFFYFFLGTVPIFLLYLYVYTKNYLYFKKYGDLWGTFSLSLLAKTKNYLHFLYTGFDLSFYHNSLFYAFIIFVLIALLGLVNLLKLPDRRKIYYAYVLIFFLINFVLMIFSHDMRFYLVYPTLFGLLILLIPVYYNKSKWLKLSVFLTLIAFFLFQDFVWIRYFYGTDYQKFEKQLVQNIPKETTVLGRINYRTSFEDNKYISLEDLIRFCASDGMIEDYIDKYKIQFIVYDYGWHFQSESNNATPFEETKRFLKNNTELVAVIYDNYYSNRYGTKERLHLYLPYFNLIDGVLTNDLKNKNYWTKIYKVKD